MCSKKFVNAFLFVFFAVILYFANFFCCVISCQKRIDNLLNYPNVPVPDVKLVNSIYLYMENMATFVL